MQKKAGGGAIAQPIARYEFKDSSDYGKDSTGHFDLTLQGELQDASSVENVKRGVYFNGASKLYASTDSNGKDFSDYLYDFTVSFWVWNPLNESVEDVDGSDKYSSILSTGVYGVNKGICYKIHRRGYHNIYAFNNNGVYAGIWADWKAVNTWHHVVYSVSNSSKQVRLYFDGVIATNGQGASVGEINDISVPMENLSDVFTLGAGSYGGGSNSFYTGYIDDVIVYDFAVDSANVTSLYNREDILQSAVPSGVKTIDSAEVVSATAKTDTSDSDMKKVLGGKTTTTVTYGGESHDVSVIWGTDTDRSNDGYVLVDGISFINGVSNYNAKIKAKVVPPTAYTLPLLWYKFDDASNIGKDSMGNYDLTPFGTVGVGSEGGASFDGTNCLYLSPVSGGHDFIDELTTFTVSFNAKSTATDNAIRRIVSHGFCGASSGFAVVQNPSGFIHFPIENSAKSDPWWQDITKFSDFGSWHNYSLVFSPSLATLYVDGTALISVKPGDDKSLSAVSEYFAFAFGGSYHIGDSAVSDGFIGDIKDLRIYDFAMSSDEVFAVCGDDGMSAGGTGISGERETIASYVVLNENSEELEYAKYVPETRLKDVITEQNGNRYYGKIKVTSGKGGNKEAKVLWCSADDEKIIGFIIGSEYDNTSSIRVSIGVKVEIEYTLNDGENNVQNKTAYSVGETVTLQNPTKKGSLFVGWKIGDTLNKPLSEVTFNDNTVAEAIFVELETTGASVRFSEPSGLRFENMVSANDYNALAKILSEENITLGTLIIPTSMLGSSEELTLSTADVLNIERTKWKSTETEGYNKFCAALTEIPEAHYKTELTATAYITVKYSDGSVVSYYGNSIVRSISQVASSALEQSAFENEEQKALLEKFKGE